MAHSHHMHREHQVSHRRVSKILEEAPAEAKKHAAGSAFSKVTSKSAAESHDSRPSGKSAPKRYARGGKVGKGNTTNIIIAGGGQKQPMPMPVPVPAGAGGPPPGAGGPPPGAGGPPPGAPPPGAMPMRKSGGRVIKGGESTKANLDAMSKRAKDNSYARGGKITAGSLSGEGRLQKASIAKRGK